MKEINYIYVCLFLIISLNLSSCKTLKNTFKSFADDSEIATITKNDENALVDAIEILNKNGGTIYIDTPIINITNTSLTLTGKISGGIIGIRQPNGQYPRISFINSKLTKELSGLFIYGSNKFIEYMIFEHSLTYGVQVLGENNIFDHVMSRYNKGSGFLVDGDFNTFNYCYSYRNFDTNLNLVNSDGFRIQSEMGTVIYNCFSWDNCNTGFNYIRTRNCSDLSFVRSGSWNNGNVDVFTGKYDYDSGYPLDRNLWTIQDIIKSDKSYVNNYYNKKNKKFSIANAKIGELTANEWVAYVNPKMRGEGFTFGNQNSSQSIDVRRISNYNVAFNNKAGGFVDNFNHKYNAFITNTVAFNNGINFKFPFYTLSKWSNNWSWNSRNKEQLNGDAALMTPQNTNTAQRLFINVRNQITNAAFSHKFPDVVSYDKAIESLK